MTTFDEQIRDRRKLAEERQIAYKAFVVLSYLGKSPLLSSNNHFRSGTLHLNWEGTTTIRLDGRRVFETGDNDQITSYVPGAWEDELEKLYAVALPRKIADEKIRQSQLKAAQERVDAAARAKWGL